MKTCYQFCCNECNQEHARTLGGERRFGPSPLWRLFGWLLREKRNGFDRRARVESARHGPARKSPGPCSL
jgi:hypothetical protein